MRELTADYVIVGAGASALAFADALLSETAASMILVDRRGAPGGHWNEAYPFVRLHGPALMYGVESLPLGSADIETGGLNDGLLALAGADEIRAYFDRIMRERLLPSGRVDYLPLHEWRSDGTALSRLDGAPVRLRARRKLVDATFADTRLPVSDPPPFAVGSGVRLVAPHELPALAEPADGYVVLGAGKTAMDTVVWLLERGVAPHAITWVRPRDSWMIPRETVQLRLDFFEDTIGGVARELEIAGRAASLEGLFRSLEAAGLMVRVDGAVEPSMFRCAIVSRAELAQMRRVVDVVRMGRVRALEAGRMLLDGGEVRVGAGRVFVNCTADGIPKNAPQPIFQDGRIVLQYVRRCAPCLSAAMVAAIEARVTDEAEKQRLVQPIPPPDEPRDWLRQQLLDAGNRKAFGEHPGLQRWLAGARLDPWARLMAEAAAEGHPARLAILARIGAAAGPALANLAKLLSREEALAPA
ncbi:MAG: hypothetical protein ABW042_09405 [Phenylobacterium sp.]